MTSFIRFPGVFQAVKDGRGKKCLSDVIPVANSNHTDILNKCQPEALTSPVLSVLFFLKAMKSVLQVGGDEGFFTGGAKMLWISSTQQIIYIFLFYTGMYCSVSEMHSFVSRPSVLQLQAMCLWAELLSYKWQIWDKIFKCFSSRRGKKSNSWLTAAVLLRWNHN